VVHSRSLVALAFACALASCTPPPAVEPEVRATEHGGSGTGMAGATVGEVFFGTSTQTMRGLAAVVAAGVEGITGGQTVEIASAHPEEAELAESVAFRDQLARAFEEHGQKLARREGEGSVIVTSEILSIERLQADRDLVTVSTVVTSRDDGRVLTTRLDRVIVRDLLTAPTYYRTSRPPGDFPRR
jgi:hypothetical protein